MLTPILDFEMSLEEFHAMLGRLLEEHGKDIHIRGLPGTRIEFSNIIKEQSP